MITQHTEGLWVMSRHGTPDHSPQFGIYSENNDSHRDFITVKGDNAEANARLIVEAPELLMIAKAYRNLLEKMAATEGQVATFHHIESVIRRIVI
jgi:hypothetical protein